jgi:glucose/mannose-6-phosphate isomerase
MQKLTILDQQEKVKAIDKSNMLEACEKTPDFCRDALKRAEKTELPTSYKPPKNVIVAGMGGSAIGGELLKDWLHDTAAIPIEVCRDYILPAYASEKSLVIAVSYSGETEETLSAFLEAVKRRCMVVTVSSGGHLQTFSQKLTLPHITIPTGLPAPRAAIAYLLFPLVALMEKLCVAKKTSEEIKETFYVLQKISEENALRIPLKDNVTKKLASEIRDTIPIVYGFRQYNAVARRLKCQFNENSKVPSKFDVFSELNHNEVVGWEAPRNLTKTFSILVIRDPEEPLEIEQRIEVTRHIASKKVCKILEIRAAGKQKLAKMLSAMYLGDFVSIYLALLRGIDPTPTKTIAYLKREMKKKFDMTARFEKEIEKII